MKNETGAEDNSEISPLDEFLGTVGTAMTTGVLVLDSHTPADVAARRMEDSGVSGAPVVDEGRVVGVVTLADLLARAGAKRPIMTSGPFLRVEGALADLKVDEAMTAQVVTANPDWPLARAVSMMEEAGVNRLPVVDVEGRLVGILARDDVIRAIARSARRESTT
jgi:CBS domain-containing protein